jgi:hypothetical protein
MVLKEESGWINAAGKSNDAGRDKDIALKEAAGHQGHSGCKPYDWPFIPLQQDKYRQYRHNNAYYF